MNGRRLLVASGIVAFGLGVAVLTFPDAVFVPLDRLVVILVGLLALVQAFRAVESRHRTKLRHVDLPDVELPPSAPTPGDRLDDALSQFTDARRVYYHGSHVREDLSAAVVAVLSRYGSYSEEAARERLDAGTWTDDPYAVAFLRDPTAPERPLTRRVRALATGESSFQRNVRHTVDAIVALTDLPPASNAPDAGDTRGRGFGRRAYSPEHRTTVAALSEILGDDQTDEQVGQMGEGWHQRFATGHWAGIGVVALVGIGVGILAEQAGVVLAGVVGIGYAAYARSTTLPEVSLSVERSLSDDRPELGDRVDVTVSVTNDGSSVLPDVSLVDGVPEALGVVDGSPRLGTTLRPGETVSTTYAVTATRGTHEFEPLLVVSRSLTSAVEAVRLVDVETTLSCVPALRTLPVSVPLREQRTRYTGRLDVASGGEGVEFYATRAYRPGDPMNRVDWNRRARSGELATLEFREERAATVVLVVDARPAAYVAPSGATDHAVDRAVDAARQVFATLLTTENRVGATAVADEDCWLPPGSGEAHRTRARTLFATHPALDSLPPEGDVDARRWQRTLRRRLPAGSQVVFFSPLCDPTASRTARTLDAHGHPVTVVSPDPTTDATPTHRLSRLGRHVAMTDLRNRGIPVVDWSWDDSIATALASFERRSR
ncbi:MAG: DUF7269 family protein [Halobacteriota archaeon]